MKPIIFERSIKDCLYYIREYGMSHSEYKNNPAALMSDESLGDEFKINVHTGFKHAQDDCIKGLVFVLKEQRTCKTQLKLARGNRDKTKASELENNLKQLEFQEKCYRKIADSIAWQILGWDLTVIRRFYTAQEPIDVSDSNISSEIRYIDEFAQSNPGGFALISDLTSFIQVGDILETDGHGQIKVIELKEGETNSKVFSYISLIEHANQEEEANIQQSLHSESPKFIKQFKRDLKQIQKAGQLEQVLRTGKGTDLASGLNVTIGNNKPIDLGSFFEIVQDLLKKSNRTGFAHFWYQGCLSIGVYDTQKCKQMKYSLPLPKESEYVAVNFKHSFYSPLTKPLYLLPFSEADILNIIMGRKVLIMALDINRWLDLFKVKGFEFKWLSVKETSHLKSKTGGNTMFIHHNKALEICNDKRKIIVGNALMGRLFFELTSPIDLITIIEYQLNCDDIVFDEQSEE